MADWTKSILLCLLILNAIAFQNQMRSVQAQRLTQVANDDLVLYLPMNEGEGGIIFDKIGTFNAEIFGAKWKTEGSITALEFDGEDDYLEINPPPSIISNELTISLFVKYYSYSKSDWSNTVISQDDDLTRIFQLSIWDGYANWHRFGGANPPDLFSIERVTLEKWTHLVVTYDGEFHKLYVDSLLQEEDQDPMGFDNIVPINIGRKTSGEYYLNGMIDEIRIFDGALTQDEVGDLFILGHSVNAETLDKGDQNESELLSDFTEDPDLRNFMIFASTIAIIYILSRFLLKW